MPNEQSPTLRKIAGIAGVSRQTASDALRGTGRVREETREKIREIAGRLGYRPDPLISIGLSQMRKASQARIQSTLAFVETGPFPDQVLKYPAFGRMMTGVRERAGELGYFLDNFWLGAYLPKRGRLESILRARGITGVIILYVQDWTKPQESGIAFDPKGFACVTLGSRVREPELDFACSDHFGNTMRALSELEKAGAKRTALVIPKGLDELVERRISSAYEGWAREKASRLRVPPFYDICATKEDFLKRLVAWFEKWQPDAIYGLDPWDALPSLAEAQKHRVIVATMEWSPGNMGRNGTDQAHEAVGSAAVDMVHGQLSHGRHGVPPIARGFVIEGHWMQTVKQKHGGRRKSCH